MSTSTCWAIQRVSDGLYFGGKDNGIAVWVKRSKDAYLYSTNSIASEHSDAGEIVIEVTQETTFHKGKPPLKRGSYIVNYLEWRSNRYESYRVSSTAVVFRQCDGIGGSRLRRRDQPDISSDDVTEWAWAEIQPTETDITFLTLDGWNEKLHKRPRNGGGIRYPEPRPGNAR